MVGVNKHMQRCIIITVTTKPGQHAIACLHQEAGALGYPESLARFNTKARGKNNYETRVSVPSFALWSKWVMLLS